MGYEIMTLEEFVARTGRLPRYRARKSKVEFAEQIFKLYITTKGKEILDCVCLSVGDFMEIFETSNPYPYITYLKNRYDLIRMKYRGMVYYCIKKK